MSFVKIGPSIDAKALKFLYHDLQKTDREIAEFLTVDRTTIVKLRKRYGIESRETVGEIGEEKAEQILRKKGFQVKNMNDEDKLSPYDLLVDGKHRIDVKTAMFSENHRFTFGISEQAKRGTVPSDTRIMLPNGRMRKDFSKTCDFLLFVCIKPRTTKYYLIPSDEFPAHISTFNISDNDRKYAMYRNNWDTLKKPPLQREPSVKTSTAILTQLNKGRPYR